MQKSLIRHLTVYFVKNFNLFQNGPIKIIYTFGNFQHKDESMIVTYCVPAFI